MSLYALYQCRQPGFGFTDAPGCNKCLARGGALYRLRIEGIHGRPLFRARINFGG